MGFVGTGWAIPSGAGTGWATPSGLSIKLLVVTHVSLIPALEGRRREGEEGNVSCNNGYNDPYHTFR